MVCGKLYHLISQLANCLRPLANNVMKILYQACILHIIDYCDVLWFPTNSQLLLEKIGESTLSKYIASINTNYSVFKFILIEQCRFHTAIAKYKLGDHPLIQLLDILSWSQCMSPASYTLKLQKRSLCYSGTFFGIVFLLL